MLYLESFIEPFGTLWFIYLLPVFFVVTKATRRAPPLAIWFAAAALEMLHVATGWTVIDEFCARFVYFYSGYLFATYVFALSDRARARPAFALAGLALWMLVNGGLVRFGFSEWPVISLALGLAGACAIVVIGTLLAQARWLEVLRYCGEHSIVIYLAFFLPMAATRTLLLEVRADPRHRHDLAARHHRRHFRRAGDLVDGARHEGELPVRTTGGILDRAEEGACRVAGGGVTSAIIARSAQPVLGSLVPARPVSAIGLAALCGAPWRQPRNPPRNVGPKILVLGAEALSQHRLLVGQDKGVEGEPHEPAVSHETPVAEQDPLGPE